MKNLAELQVIFKNYLLNADTNIKQHVISSATVSAETRLAIYSNAYQARLTDNLAVNYPVFCKYLGDDYFKALAHEYIQQHPSTHRSVRWFGDNLVTFLQQHSKYASYEYVIELAQFEWAMTLVFDAADCDLLTVDAMGTIPSEVWEKLRFCFHPSLQRLNLFWNVNAIWQSLSQDQTPPEPIQTKEPTSWILWRKDFFNHYCSLSETESSALDTMLSGHTFADLCEGLCRSMAEEEVGLYAASLLKSWIINGLITKVEF